MTDELPEHLRAEQRAVEAQIREAFRGVTRDGGVSWRQALIRDIDDDTGCPTSWDTDRWEELVDDATWEPDPAFDVRHHVMRHVLRPPGDDRQLVKLASRLFAEPLHRGRPLWELHQIDGYRGDRSALVAKVQGAYEAKLNALLSSPAGRAYVAWNAAANVSFSQTLTFSSQEGIPSVLRLRRFAEQFMGSGGR